MASGPVLALAALAAACGCGARSAGEARVEGGGAAGSGARSRALADAAREPEAGTDFCPALPPPEGRTIRVGPRDAGTLDRLVREARPGDTVLFADGTYALHGVSIQVETPGVTLRSASGDRDRVVLDGGYETDEVVGVHASDVTIASLTIRRAATHPIHVVPPEGRSIRALLVYDVVLEDPGQQAIKVNPVGEAYVDEGVVACSRIALTDAGRDRVWQINESCYTGGVDVHAGRGWVVRDNHIEGFFCPRDLSEHGVHFWRDSRDTVVERNVIVDCARGIGFGLGPGDVVRRYDDAPPCPAAGDTDHLGGVIRNNFVLATRPELFASEAGFDSGIGLLSACGASALHNTVAATSEPFASIEWRFPTSRVEVLNNLVTHGMRERDGAAAASRGNVEGAPLDVFVDPRRGDLHLAAGASAALDRGVALEPGRCDRDIDGDERGSPPDVGADERR